MQSSSLLIVPVSVNPKPIVLSSIPEITTEAPTTTISLFIPPFIPILPHLTPIPTPTTTEATTSTLAVLESKTLSAIHLRVPDLEKEVKQLRNVDHSTLLLATIKSEVPTAVKEYLGTSFGDALHKIRKTSKDVEPSKRSKSTNSSKGNTSSQPKPKYTGKSIHTEETVYEAEAMETLQNQGDDMGTTNVQPNVEAGDRCPFDLSKPLPLVESRGHQIVHAHYFFDNDLEYLRGGSTDKKYTTSITNTKANKYDLKGIKDMVPTLWSPIKVAYDKHVALGTSHWGPKQQSFYGYATNRVSKHDVYSTKRILAVTNVKVNKWYGYGHLEEIEVRREDQQLCNKFMEGDFPRLHLNDIEDMLLLVVQNKLFDLKVKSYQKKLSISKPRKRDEDLSRKAPDTTLSYPQGVIYYRDRLNRKRLIRSDELHKFSDGTL
ncbi:hypothetical protein Tco_0086578 [Tanacetum coccineum]